MINHAISMSMNTPKLHTTLCELFAEENAVLRPESRNLSLGSMPTYKEYLSAQLAGDQILGETVRFNRAGRIEAVPPRGPKAYLNRLKTRALVRFVVGAVRSGAEVGEQTRQWLSECLRADDLKREAEAALKRVR